MAVSIIVHGLRFSTAAVSISTWAIGIAEWLCLLVHGLRYSTVAVYYYMAIGITQWLCLLEHGLGIAQ